MTNYFTVGHIECTNDYRIFHTIDGNRKVERRLDLFKSMALHGFDKNQRIKIWPDGAIADGQHRLQTAIELKLAVWFEVIEEPKDETRLEYIQRINSTSKDWKGPDFIHSKACADPVYANFEKLKAKYVDDKKSPLRVTYTVFQVCVGLSGKGGKKEIFQLSQKMLGTEEIEKNIQFAVQFTPFILNDARSYIKGLLMIKKARLMTSKEEKALISWMKAHPGCLPAVNGNIQQAFIWIDQAFNRNRRKGQISWSLKYAQAKENVGE